MTGSKKLASNPRAVEWAAEGGLAGDGHRHRFYGKMGGGGLAEIDI